MLFRSQKDNKYSADTIDEEVSKMLPHLQWQLIKEQILKTLNVKVEESDILALAKMMAAQQFAQYGMGNVPEDVLEKYARELVENENYRKNIVERAVEEKLFAAITEAVTLEEKNISANDFNALFEAK